jgi:hypothetical protein
MNKNLEFYVSQYSNFLDKETCENVLKEIKNLKWEEHRFYNPKEKNIIIYLVNKN